MAGTAVTKKGIIHGQGGRIELYTFSLDPASIAADAQGVETLTISGAKAGDMVFVSPEAAEKHLIPAGAKVTADDTVSVYINNNFTATTALDGAAKTWSLMIVKFST